jgi:lipopolysaccharide transport system permease protein
MHMAKGKCRFMHMKTWIVDLFRFRELLLILTWKEIHVKYKQSVMGFLWAILMPCLIIAAGVMVRFAYSKLTGNPLGMEQIATVSVKALPWAFFTAALRFSTASLTANSNLVTKIYFPRDIFPIAAVLSQFFDFLIAAVLLIVILVVAQIGVSVYLLWVPFLIVCLVVFVTGVGIFLSAANLFFRDVRYLVEVFVSFAIFITPVFYEAKMFGDWGRLMLLNPVAAILEGLNDSIVLHQSPEWTWMLYSGTVAVVVFVLSLMVFKRLEPKFAESI